jgi:DNA-binding transcriptional regulator LsrR (DeoR family)
MAVKMPDQGPQATRPTRTLLHTVAKLHYVSCLPQSEIARRLGFSTATVSRLIRRAHEEGIVRIEVRDIATTEAIADELASRLALRCVVVIETPSEAGTLAALSTPVGQLLRDAGLHQGSVLAIGWGRTVWEVIQAGLPRCPGVLTVPASGGMQEPALHFQVNEFIRLAAEQMGGVPKFIHAPYLPSLASRAAFLADPTIREHVVLWDRLDVALFGIGLPYPVDLAHGGTASTPVDPILANAAGDVLQHFYDIDGKLIAWEGEQRLIAISPAQLRQVPLAIGVAVSPEKAPGILGAARAGLINALVTDTRSAQATLDLL